MRRVEKDYLGKVLIPDNAYWGVQTQRAIENFRISGLKPHPEYVISTAMVKRAAAEANMAVGVLDSKIGSAIVQAASEIMRGKLLDQFVVDVFQAGAGTSHNMNANEVIANRAIELLGGRRGNYASIHPNDHVNRSQSTNDVIPTIMKITFLRLLVHLRNELRLVELSFRKKAKRFDKITKLGRTHLMDAAPVRLGQEFLAYSVVIRKASVRLEKASECLLELNIGATAVGTGLNADSRYIQIATERLMKMTGFNFHSAENLMAITQSMAEFVEISSALKELAIDLTKILNDLRLMNSGPIGGIGEIALPAVQPGSSIMPGKINPVIAEAMNMICFEVMGNDLTVSLAAQSGQLELNVMTPVIANKIIQSLVIMTNGLKMMRNKMIEGITANEWRCRQMVERSPALALALNPYLGFEKTAEVVMKAIRDEKTVKEVVQEMGLMDIRQLDQILDIYSLTEMSVDKKRSKKKIPATK